MRQGAGPQLGATEALFQSYVGDDTLFAVVTESIADLADDLADVDQEEAFLGGTGAAGDAGGQELDRSVDEEPTPQAVQGSATARVPGAVLALRYFLNWRDRAEQSARRTRMLSVHASPYTPRRVTNVLLAVDPGTAPRGHSVRGSVRMADPRTPSTRASYRGGQRVSVTTPFRSGRSGAWTRGPAVGLGQGRAGRPVRRVLRRAYRGSLRRAVRWPTWWWPWGMMTCAAASSPVKMIPRAMAGTALRSSMPRASRRQRSVVPAESATPVVERSAGWSGKCAAPPPPARPTARVPPARSSLGRVGSSANFPYASASSSVRIHRHERTVAIPSTRQALFA